VSKINAHDGEGYEVVLTADRTLMSHYNGLVFLGFSACVPKGLIPDIMYFSMLCPSIESNNDGSVKYAPCGTRKIEAALLNKGFKREDVIVAHPEHLDKVIGPNTKVLAISGFDPLGIAPATSTFTQLLGGNNNYMSVKFEELLNHPAVQHYQPKIIVGGPGAWQLEDDEPRNRLGLDCVVIGEGEKVVDTLFKKAINGEEIPNIVHGEVLEEEEIPSIKEPTIEGIVEIARGCGRGCAFCVPTLQRYRCLPIEHILEEVEVNLRAGKQPILHAEDVLRYKAKGFNVNKEAVTDLFRQVHDYPGVEAVAMSHFALSSVASASEVVEEVSNILGANKNEWLTGQTGIETGSPKLINDGMKGKCKPFKPEDWPEVVVNAFQILSDNNWVPIATLIIGLPGEDENDVQLTIDLISELTDFKSIIIPLFFVSEGRLEGLKSFSVEEMTHKQCELMLRCWEHSQNWTETLLDEYFHMTNVNSISTFGAKRVFTYALGKSRKLVKMCEDDYGYDIQKMLQDARNGEITMIPKPLQVIYNHFVQ
jgi:radical SAM superfamily enzyme YgiQ (UPF0313 family)